MGVGGGTVNRSSLTEDSASTPGWVDGRIDEAFASLGAPAAAARESYARCLGGVGGAEDVDGGHDRCRRAAIEALLPIVQDEAKLDALDKILQALEAEISAST